MFTCFACRVGKQLVFSGSDAFLAHIQFYHSSLVISGKLICTHKDCFKREYDKFNSFRKHVKSHKIAVETTCLPILQTSISVEHAPQGSNSVEQTHNPSSVIKPMESTESTDNYEQFEARPTFSKHDSLKFDEALTSSVVSHIATMYDMGLTETQIQNLIDSERQLLAGPFLSILKQNVLDVFSAHGAHAQTSKHVSRMFDSLTDMFDGFHTTYLRLKEFQSCGAFIPPEPFVIGQALNETTVNGETVMEPVALTGQFVPMRKVLKGFLELRGVLKSILDYIVKLEADQSNVLENIIQGDLWKEKIKPKFEGKTVLPINFFCDDYETNKALGAHAGVHNLGAGYVRLPCIPPEYQGVLENIFLFVLFHSTDKYFGNDKLFRKVVNELLFLEEEGIVVVLPEGKYRVYFSLCISGGDNKGANEILGYVQGFSANYYCRICSMKRTDAAKSTRSDPSKLRTPASYETELRINDQSLTGRRSLCIFNLLLSFHVYLNFHLDTMHDLDEGVWKYLMTEIVKYFISKGYFSLTYLNELIQGFYYGPNEQRNKFPLILQEHFNKNKTLKGSASEMRCLLRYFGLIVGHLVEEGDSVWQLYLIARSIVDIVTAPCLHRSDAPLLKNLIKEHHEYIELFETDLKPKFHLMTHLPEILLLLGPPEPLSCMRIEAKHKKGVEIARKSHNRLNLPYTVASRYQLDFAFRLLSGRGFAANFECSKVQLSPLYSISKYSSFIDVIPPEFSKDVWTTVKWVETNGTKYQENTVVVLSVQNGVPLFGSIHVISVRENNDVFFITKILKTVKFDKHFHAWEVCESNEWKFINLKQLHTHVATEIRLGGNRKRYVAFRFSLCR